MLANPRAHELMVPSPVEDYYPCPPALQSCVPLDIIASTLKCHALSKPYCVFVVYGLTRAVTLNYPASLRLIITPNRLYAKSRHRGHSIRHPASQLR